MGNEMHKANPKGPKISNNDLRFEIRRQRRSEVKTRCVCKIMVVIKV